jgi:hypothetical protein
VFGHRDAASGIGRLRFTAGQRVVLAAWHDARSLACIVGIERGCTVLPGCGE